MDTKIKTADSLKLVCLGLSYVFSFAYVYMFMLNLEQGPMTIYFTVLSVVAIIWLELTIRQKILLGDLEKNTKRTIETRFWEVIIVCLSLNIYFGLGQEYPIYAALFLHASIVYAVLCGTGHLFRDGSSVFMPGDLINGFARIPFANFPGRIIAIVESIMLRKKDKGEVENGVESKSSSNTPKVILGAGIAVVCFITLIVAFNNLANVDSNFANARSSIEKFLMNIKIDETLIATFILSIPVGMYLFGLFQGSVRMKNHFEKRVEANITRGISKAKIISKILFSIILIIFIGVYLAFFISQASYMFSGFFGILPEEFTASEYAVSGFYELIRVVVINFFLLALIRAFSVESKLIRILTVILMAESTIFSTISASKIILYMSRFGYTEARTLGLWGTAVVFVGTILAIMNLTTKYKKVFAPWLWFSAASYVVMNFIAYNFR
ncbi:MAG: DUF4173 domain-containing protein [Clostridiales bacterium]|nr:DUF4173 domain-containing protein [Clostridiales bacterium]